VAVALRIASASDAGEDVERAAAFRDAHRAMRSGDADRARRDFERSLREVPELADHALLYASRLARAAGDRDAARAHLDSLLSEHPDSVWTAAASVDRGELALDDDPARALDLFSRSIEDPDLSLRARAKLGRARALAAQGRNPEAYAAARDLAGARPPVGPEARLVRERLEALGPAALGVSAPELSLEIARARLREGRAQDAIDAIAPTAEETGPLRGAALLERARAYRALGEPSRARADYSSALEGGDAAIAATALLERGRLAWNRDEDAVADVDFAALIELEPDGPERVAAVYARARIAESREDLDAAAGFYDVLAASAAADPRVKEGAWRAAFVRFREGDAAVAAARFAELAENAESLHWRARSLAKAGSDDEARALWQELLRRYPREYPAWWAEGRLGAAAPSSSPSAIASTPVAPLSLAPATSAHLRRGDLLAALAVPDDAAREYAAVEAAAGPEPLLVSRYHRVGAFGAEIRLALRLAQRGGPSLEHLYPRAHADEFERASRSSGLDPLLLSAVARRESLFEPRALSTAGAHGVLQLMPATARTLVGREVATEELEDPAFNIEIGARYLRSLLDRYEGRLVLALAAYNAGPDKVDRWLERNPRLEGDEFVESIGFGETRDYVKAVLTAYRSYRALYGAPDAARPRLF
jgi:soluble lytic murein transglycosylase